MTYIALIAHDPHKQQMAELVLQHHRYLSSVQTVSTEHTCDYIELHTPLTITKKVFSGPNGGDKKITRMIRKGNIAALIFFRDHDGHPHTDDIEELLTTADAANIPTATNRHTADIILNHLRNSEHDTIRIPYGCMAI